MVPDYLRTFRQAVHKSENCEKSVLSEKRVGLNSLNSLISHLPAERFPFAEALGDLERRCPDYIELDRWQQCVIDAQRFLATWGDKAVALGWTAGELFGLHESPERPHPSYNRLSRYDYTGLIWHLQGCRVVALTDDAAAIEGHTGNIVTYRKAHKPAYGPVGNSFDDFTGN